MTNKLKNADINLQNLPNEEIENNLANLKSRNQLNEEVENIQDERWWEYLHKDVPDFKLPATIAQVFQEFNSVIVNTDVICKFCLHFSFNSNLQGPKI